MDVFASALNKVIIAIIFIFFACADNVCVCAINRARWVCIDLIEATLDMLTIPCCNGSDAFGVCSRASWKTVFFYSASSLSALALCV